MGMLQGRTDVCFARGSRRETETPTPLGCAENQSKLDNSRIAAVGLESYGDRLAFRGSVD